MALVTEQEMERMRRESQQLREELLGAAHGWAALEQQANQLYDQICDGSITVDAAEKEIARLCIEACREQANEWRETRAIRDAYKPGDYDAD